MDNLDNNFQYSDFKVIEKEYDHSLDLPMQTYRHNFKNA